MAGYDCLLCGTSCTEMPCSRGAYRGFICLNDLMIAKERLFNRDTTLKHIEFDVVDALTEHPAALLSCLAHNTSVRYFRLANIPVDMNSALGIQWIIENNDTLTTIVLYNASLSIETTNVFLPMLSKNKTLKELSLSNNGLNGEAFKKTLPHFAAPGVSLKTLGLAGNDLTDSDINEICYLIRTARSLESLNLDFNNLTDASLPHLEEALLDNKTLKRFTLSYNFFTTINAFIARMEKKRPKLEITAVAQKR